MKIKIHWNKYLEKFVITDLRGKNVYEFPDCANFNMVFPALNKKREGTYVVKARRVCG